MKKSEFKKLVKEMVRECIHEEILESGILSAVISEVMSGLQPMLTERRQAESFHIEDDEPVRRQSVKKVSSQRAREVLDADQNEHMSHGNTVWKEAQRRAEPKPALKQMMGGIDVFADVTTTEPDPQQQGMVNDGFRNELMEAMAPRWQQHLKKGGYGLQLRQEMSQMRGSIDNNGRPQNSGPVRAPLINSADHLKSVSKQVSLETAPDGK